MNKKSVFILITAIIVAAFGHVFAEGATGSTMTIRDPFSPFLSGGSGPVGSASVDGVQAQPLQKFPAQSYDLIGVVSSKKRSIGMIRTPEGANFFLYKGDELGADNFKVTEISGLKLILEDANGQEMTKRVQNMVTKNEE